MKRIFTLSLAMLTGIWMFSQSLVPEKLQNLSQQGVSMHSFVTNQNDYLSGEIFQDYKIDEWAEEIIGETVFDLQSNYSSQNRLYMFEDGTLGATWTMGFQTTTFPDRGTGYNYYDGTDWGEYPTERIESERNGWPSYIPYGTNGEVVCAHTTSGNNGLVFNYRTDKGTGEWNDFFLTGPAGNEDLTWPRAVTAGVDHMSLHVFAITLPTANGGALYNGMDGALLYNRSLDGGVTWDINNIQPPEVTVDEYLALGGDYYAIAEPKGETLAFICASKWHDMFVLKSTNNGEDWEKIMIWEHPYPLFDWQTTVTDTFYTIDGAVAAAIDNYGDVHVVFGLTRVGHFEIGDTYTSYPFIDGLGYWNEGMPPFESDDPLNTMKPDNLVEDETLIGWTLDINGNGIWDVIGTVESLGNYRTGISSMPQITIDENDNVYVLYSSIAETFQTDDQNYKHLNLRVSYDNGETWSDTIHDLTGDVSHFFSECVHGVMSPTSNDYIHIIYQEDTEPGGAVQGDLDPYATNRIPYIKVMKDELGVGINNGGQTYLNQISQNFPNPASSYTTVNIHLMNPAEVGIEVFSLTGQKVIQEDKGSMPVGVHTLTLDVSGLSPGSYFYSVKANNETITNKLQIR